MFLLFILVNRKKKDRQQFISIHTHTNPLINVTTPLTFKINSCKKRTIVSCDIPFNFIFFVEECSIQKMSSFLIFEQAVSKRIFQAFCKRCCVWKVLIPCMGLSCLRNEKKMIHCRMCENLFGYSSRHSKRVTWRCILE